MSLFFNGENAEVIVLKILNTNVDPDVIISDLEMHPNYSSMLAITDVVNGLNIDTKAIKIDFV